MRKLVSPLTAMFVALVFVGAGCSSTSTTTSGSGTSTATNAPATTPATSAPTATGELTVSAAASLKTPFTTIGDDFEKANPGVTDVKFSFDSSGTLAKQIKEASVSTDGFASADEANMKVLTDANLIAGTPTVFARNKLTIVVKKGNPKNIKTLADLATAGTISLCASTAPCGKYADQILATAKVTIPTDKVTRNTDAKSTFAAVSEGDADAGIVYVTDVTGDKTAPVVIADAENVIATYPIGVVRSSNNQATMQAFIAYVMSGPGQATLEAAGFMPPS